MHFWLSKRIDIHYLTESHEVGITKRQISFLTPTKNRSNPRKISIVTESRSVVTQGEGYRGYNGTLATSADTHCLHCGDSFTGICINQSLAKLCTLNMYNLLFLFYLNKAILRKKWGDLPKATHYFCGKAWVLLTSGWSLVGFSAPCISHQVMNISVLRIIPNLQQHLFMNSSGLKKELWFWGCSLSFKVPSLKSSESLIAKSNWMVFEQL